MSSGSSQLGCGDFLLTAFVTHWNLKDVFIRQGGFNKKMLLSLHYGKCRIQFFRNLSCTTDLNQNYRLKSSSGSMWRSAWRLCVHMHACKSWLFIIIVIIIIAFVLKDQNKTISMYRFCKEVSVLCSCVEGILQANLELIVCFFPQLPGRQLKQASRV